MHSKKGMFPLPLSKTKRRSNVYYEQAESESENPSNMLGSEVKSFPTKVLSQGGTMKKLGSKEKKIKDKNGEK